MPEAQSESSGLSTGQETNTQPVGPVESSPKISLKVEATATSHDQIRALAETSGRPERENLPETYRGSEYISMLDAQEAGGRASAALFTDIDNTFFRSDRAEASRQLYEGLHEESYPVVAVTGNGIEDVIQRIEAGELPYFPIIAAAVGTEIYVLHEEDGKKVYKKDERYEQILLEKGFDRPKLATTGQQMVEDVKGQNAQYQGETHPEWKLDFQHPIEERAYREGNPPAETPFKMSFHAFASSETSLVALRAEMAKRFPGQQIVISEEINYNSKMQPNDTNKKYNIDILPITKAGAVNYISDTTGVAIKVVAGDSGNDSEMLTGTGDVSIIVGGAKPELTTAVDEVVSETEENRHFQRVRDEEGNLAKLYYREKGEGLGPESIARAIRFLKLAQRLHHDTAEE